MTKVEIVTGARLHFGLMCGEPETGWNFGGIGLMLESPSWHLTAAAHESIQINGAARDIHKRLAALLPDVCVLSGLPGLRVDVLKSMPLHCGLGAGTQLALAAATAALVVAGKPRPKDSIVLADSVGRARRSAIGTRGFDRGGFLVDEGQSNASSGRSLRRMGFPEEWRMVLVRPLGSQGLCGAQEEAVFDERLRMSAEVMESLRQLVEEDICPAVEEIRFTRFQDALFEYGQTVGEFFSRQQGGTFSSPEISRLIQQPECRAFRAVQSSWGPTVAIPAESQADAEVICEQIRSSAAGAGMSCLISAASNNGAIVRSIVNDRPDHVARG